MELKAKEKVSYGIGAVGKDMVYMLSSSYILYYYQDVLGVNALLMGALLLIARIFDAVNDPIMGVLVAKTKTRWGKFRPWLMSGTILNALILYAMFAAPEGLKGTGLFAYAAVTYIMWGVTYTMMDIPFWSMIPAFASNVKEKESLSTLGRTCAGLGSALVTVVTIVAVDKLGGGNERAGFKYFSLVVAAFFIVAITLTCSFMKEKSTIDMPTVKIKDMFKALVKNSQAMAVVVIIVIINMSIYLTSNLVLYFFKYDFGGTNWYDSYTLFNIFGGAMQILSMMIIYPVLRKLKVSNTNIFKMCLGSLILGYLALLMVSVFVDGGIAFLFVPGFFIFAAHGLLTILTTLFLANSVDYGELMNGRRDESVIFSMQTFVVKLASGVSVQLAAVCIYVFGISKNTDKDDTVIQELALNQKMGLRLTMTIIPIIGVIIAIIFFAKKFKLTDEKCEEMTKELAKRHSEMI